MQNLSDRGNPPLSAYFWTRKSEICNIRSFHISFYWKKKTYTFCFSCFMLSSSFPLSFVILNFIIMRKSSAYVCNDFRYQYEMNAVHLQQFLPNLHNWTAVNQLFQAQLASSKRMVIWRTLRFTDKLSNTVAAQNYLQSAWRPTDQYALPVYE